jgi:hypothetical protein
VASGDVTTVTGGDPTTAGFATCKINPLGMINLSDYDVDLLYHAQMEDASGNVTTIQTVALRVKVESTKSSLRVHP